MSITRIAIGVLLGNILFSIIAGLIGLIIVSEMQARSRVRDADDGAAALQARRQGERLQRCLTTRKLLDPRHAANLPPCSPD